MAAPLNNFRAIATLAAGEPDSRAPILLLQVRHLQHLVKTGDKEIIDTFAALGVKPLGRDGTPRPQKDVYDDLGRALEAIPDRATYDGLVSVLLSPR